MLLVELVSTSIPPMCCFNSMPGTETAAMGDELVDRHSVNSDPNNTTSRPSETSDTLYSDIPLRGSSHLVFTRPSLQQLSRNLEQYCPFTNPKEGNNGNRDLATHTVSGLTMVKLKKWLSSPRSELLWIIGLNSPLGNEASIAASHILDIATSAGLPFVCFNCTPVTEVQDISQNRGTRCMTLLVALLYTLIRQLLCHVPETFEDAYELRNAIQAMNGSGESVPKALEIIQTLLRHRTPLLLVILDGLELLEDASTIPYLRELISTIHSRQSDFILKCLLGSQGFLVSGGDLGLDERVDCTLLPRRRPGRAQPGGRSLGEMNSFPW